MARAAHPSFFHTDSQDGRYELFSISLPFPLPSCPPHRTVTEEGESQEIQTLDSKEKSEKEGEEKEEKEKETLSPSVYDISGLDSSLPSLFASPPSQSSSSLPLRSLCVSGWNAPLPSRQVSGDFFYLDLVTTENKFHTITCSARGFFVNRSTNKKFDPVMDQRFSFLFFSFLFFFSFFSFFFFSFLFFFFFFLFFFSFLFFFLSFSFPFLFFSFLFFSFLLLSFLFFSFLSLTSPSPQMGPLHNFGLPPLSLFSLFHQLYSQKIERRSQTSFRAWRDPLPNPTMGFLPRKTHLSPKFLSLPASGSECREWVGGGRRREGLE